MKKNALKTLSLIFILFFICSALLLFCGTNKVNAEETAKEVSLVSPATHIEYNEISNPTFISYESNKIFLTNNSSYLFIYDLLSSKCTKYDMGDEPSRAIFDTQTNKVIVQKGETLYNFNLANSSLEVIRYDNADLTAKSFDICNDKIIMLSSNKLRSFMGNLRNDLTEWKGSDITICADNTNVFFSNTNGIDIYNLENGNVTSNFLSFIPKHMVSNGEFLFYVKDKNIYKKSIVNGEITPLSTTSDFTLGTLGTINSICLKDENLLIASTFDNGKSAIQEFAVENNKLVFTGFAISKGNSAFNRISSNAIDIEKNGRNIAVIDNEKITLIEKTDLNCSYKNILLSSFSGANKIALGKDKILIASDDGYAFASLSTLQIEHKTNLHNIKDLVFANNNFYILTCDGTNSIFYKYNGATFEQVETYESVINSFTIDVKGEIITSDKAKVLTDLVGNKFELDNGKLNGYSLKNYSQNITSFAMDIESKEIYFILENEELILSSTDFDNKAISQINLENDYKTTDKNAQSIDNLKVYTINDNSNIYSISVDSENKITYNGLTNDYKGEFVCIYQLKNDFANFSILSGYNKNNIEILVLINNNDLTVSASATASHIEKSERVVSTSVDMYYLPLINLDRSFSLKNDEYIRLNRGEKITYEKEILVNGKTFIYGEVERNGEKITGYVPKDFTVKTLSNNYILETIEKETVKEQGNNLKIIVCLFILSIIVFVTTIYFVFIRKHDSL